MQRPRTGVGILLEIGPKRLGYLSFPTPKLAALEILEATGEDVGWASASYAVRADSRPARGILRADFGPIGRVSLRFRPTGESRRGRASRACNGPRPLIERGQVRGRIDLRGEGGYFRVDAQRAEAVREFSPRLVCRRGTALNVPPNISLRELVMPSLGIVWSSGGGTIAVLNAVAKSEGRLVALRAAHDAGSPAGASLQVITLESGHDMAIGRSLELEGGRGTLRTSLPGEHPATATLAPPRPFRGEAKLLQTSARSNSWAGSLRVRLPGLDLPLTGPRFMTSLCVLSPLKNPRGCDFAKHPEPLLPSRLALIPGMAEL